MIAVPELLRIAWRAIVMNKARSFLTMLGIIIGVASVILLVSIGSGLQNFVTSQFESLGSNAIFVLPGDIDPSKGPQGGPPPTSSKLTMEHLNELRDLDEPITGAIALINRQTTVSYLDNEESIQIVGTQPEYETLRNTPVRTGRWFTESENQRARRVAVVGPSVIEKLFEGRPAIDADITINDRTFIVIGVTEAKGAGGPGVDLDNQIYIPYFTAEQVFDIENASLLLVQAQDSASVKQASRLVQRTLEKRLDEDEFTVLEQEELLNTIQQFLSVITAALGGIAAISLLVGGIGIMNIMLVSVTERTREIGLRKAVGAQFRDILIQFLLEAVTLSSIGGTIGLMLGALGSQVLNSFIQTSITPWSVVIAFGFSMFVGVVFGVAPAYKAAKLDPITALRYE